MDENRTAADASTGRNPIGRIPTTDPHRLELLGRGKLALPKGNFEATTAPTVNDDRRLNYSPGSLWLNLNTDELYVCMDATRAAAAWSLLSTGVTHTRLHTMTNTLDHSAGTWKAFYSNGSGQVIELALGAAGTVFTSQGAAVAPTFAAGGGGGHTIRENGVDLTARVGLNFIDVDAGVTLVVDDAGANETEVNLGLYALLAGRTGGQTIHGSAIGGEHLFLRSTSHATKGRIYLGAALTSAYDEANDRLGLGIDTPDFRLEARGTDVGIVTHYAGQARGGLWALSTGRIALATTDAADDLVFGFGGTSPVTSANFDERMRLDNSAGQLQLPVQGAAAGLLIGLDVQLYRADVDVLAIPDNVVIGAHYLDVANLATPANPAVGTRRVYVDSVSGELSVRTSGGSTVSLESVPAGVFLRLDGTNAMAADLNMDGNAVVLATGATVRALADNIVLQVGGVDKFQFTGATQLYTSISDTARPVFQLQRARAGPALVQTDDELGEVRFAGYDGVSYVAAAQILARATQNFDDAPTSRGTALDFYIAPNSPGTARIVLTLDQSGQAQFPITGSAAGILLGGDVQLYRSAADVLTIPDAVAITVSVTTPQVIGGADLTLRSNTSDDGIIISRFPTPTNMFPQGARWQTPAGRDLMILRAGDGGAAAERSNRLWLLPPIDGGRVGLDLYSSTDFSDDPLLNLQSHGRMDGITAAPGVQHLTWYEPLDTCTLRTAVNEAAGIPAGAKGDSIVFTVDSVTNLAVNDEILVWDTTRVPGVDIPTSSWEYMRITAINTLDLTCTRQIWGEREVAPAHVDNALVYEVTRTSVKVLQINHGPDSDGRTAGALRIHLPNADFDLTKNKLLLNGGAGVVSPGTAWWEWNEGARRWTLTGVGGDGAELLLSRDTSTDNLIMGIVQGDTNARFVVTAKGDLAWGPGTGATDIGLVRGAVGRLETAGQFAITGAGTLSVGTTSASARLHVQEATIGNEVQRLESVATNDDPRQSTFQGRVATTDATATALSGLTKAVAASTTTGMEAIVVARRTGGTAGTAEDGAMYVVRAVVKNVAGTATLIGATSVTVVGESQAGWTADIGVIGGSTFVSVVGAVNNNITWHGTLRTWPVGS